jgi:hypothetical protein
MKDTALHNISSVILGNRSKKNSLPGSDLSHGNESSFLFLASLFLLLVMFSIAVIKLSTILKVKKER